MDLMSNGLNNMDKEELNQFSKKEGFKIPDGYFNTFPERVKKRIEYSKGIIKIDIWSFFRKPQFYFPFFLLIIAVIGSLLKEMKTEKVTVANKQTGPSNIRAIQEMNTSIAQDINRDEVKNYSEQALTAAEMEEIAADTDTVAFALKNDNNYLSGNSMEEIIMEADIDEDLIIEELLRD